MLAGIADKLVTVDNVTIIKLDNYYKVVIDKTGGVTDEQTGKNYGDALKEIIPNIEALYASYLAEQMANATQFTAILSLAKAVKSNLEQEYKDEIDGLGSKIASAESNNLGDDQLTEEEFLVLALSPDLRANECSAVSVFGDLSETEKTITGRNLDWDLGNEAQLGKMHSVTIIKNHDESIVLMGFLGYLGCSNSRLMLKPHRIAEQEFYIS